MLKRNRVVICIDGDDLLINLTPYIYVTNKNPLIKIVVGDKKINIKFMFRNIN